MVYKLNDVLLPRPAKLGYKYLAIYHAVTTSFSRPWKEFKSFVQGAFYEGEIKQFEKICICIMMARRRYCWQTVAAIYGRSLPSITVYTNGMMTKLGQVGKDLSELPLEMNRIFYQKIFAGEKG